MASLIESKLQELFPYLLIMEKGDYEIIDNTTSNENVYSERTVIRGDYDTCERQRLIMVRARDFKPHGYTFVQDRERLIKEAHESLNKSKRKVRK